MTRLRHPILPALAVLLAFLLGVSGCKFQVSTGKAKKAEEKSEKEEEKKERGVPVAVTKIERGKIEDVIKASNHLEAEQEVRVLSRAANQVIELLVEEGDVVKKGQVLLRLEDTDQRLAYKKALSQLNQAKSNFARTEKMFKDELVPQKDYDDEKHRLEQLQVSLEEAERQVDFTEIKAPIAGTITSRLVKIGDHVNNGQHLFDIIDFDSIVARVYVAERHLGNLEIDQPVRVVAKSITEKVFEGFVKRIAPIVDKDSGTVKVTVGVKTRGRLRPGMYVDAELVVATHADALLIPKRAIVYGGDQMFVYLLQPKRRVKRALVEPLLTDRDFVEPKEGFKEGDEIIIAGQTGLRDDALVELPGDTPPEDEEDTDDEAEEKSEAEVTSTNAPTNETAGD